MLSQFIELDQAILHLIRGHLNAGARLVADSRQVRPGDWFVAYPGEQVDGRDYIASALSAGAAGILYEADGKEIRPIADLPMLAVPDLSSQAGALAAYLLGNDTADLTLLAVTGTNGKTSITQWLAQALTVFSPPAGVIGTVGHGIWRGDLVSQNNTTPGAIDLQMMIYQLRQQGAKNIAIEASSHGLQQSRVKGVPFSSAIFTNLTRDHLDYHHSFEAYFQAKKQLFYWPTLKHAIINGDDPYGVRLLKELRNERPQLLLSSYGKTKEADIHLQSIRRSSEGMQIQFSTSWGEVTVENRMLIGEFNAYNLAATLGLLCGLGYDLDAVARVLSQVQPAQGRMETLNYPGCATVIIDYAHTPDALQNVLQTLSIDKGQEEGELWCVFGCGGDRDTGKRPLMGEVAQRYADKVVLTVDNPRNEDPEQIMRDILPVANAVCCEADRERAIAYAINHSKVGDRILIAGKGHETYQEIKGVRYPFSDKKIAQYYLEQKLK